MNGFCEAPANMHMGKGMRAARGKREFGCGSCLRMPTERMEWPTQRTEIAAGNENAFAGML